MCSSAFCGATCQSRAFVFFFFQAEDGIRDKLVTGVQTCALPICVVPQLRARELMRGERLELEEEIRREATSRALASAKVEAQPQITALLSNGMKLKAEAKKSSPRPLLNKAGKPSPGSGRNLALPPVPHGAN